MNIWTKLSIVIFGLIPLLLLLNPDIYLTTFDDYNWHLMVAENFVRAGGVSTWDFWTSLPEGRPHIYPPLFQILLTIPIIIGVSAVNILLYAPIFFLLISTFLAWFGIKLLFGNKTAFFFLILNLSFVPYLSFLGLLGPASLVLALTPLLIYLVNKQRWLPAGILIALMLYTQMIIPWFAIAALGLWGLTSKNLKTTILSIALGITIALPWIWHYLTNSTHIKYFNDQHTIDAFIIPHHHIHLLSWTLLGCAFYFIFKQRDHINKAVFFFLFLFIAQIPLLYSDFPIRFWASGGYFSIVILLAIWLNHLDTHSRLSASIILILFLIGSPSIKTQLNQAYKIQLKWQESALTHTLFNRLDNKNQQDPLVYSPEQLRLSTVIENNSRENDIIYNSSTNLNLREYSDTIIPAQFFASLSNRGLGNRQPPEINWYESFFIPQAQILIADYHTTSRFPGNRNSSSQFIQLVDKHFQFIHQEDRLVIYANKNPDQTLKLKPTKAALPLWVAYLLIISAIIYLTYKIKSDHSN